MSGDAAATSGDADLGPAVAGSGSPSRLFFVHLMKTGGIAVSDLVRTVVGDAAVYPGPADARGRIHQKLDPRELATAMGGDFDDVRLVTVHMPAWVLDLHGRGWISATVLREPVARTVSHLRQIARILGDGHDPEQLWAEPRWRDRLVDYQVRMLGAAPPVDGRAPDPPALPDELTDEARAEVRASVGAYLATAVSEPGPVGADHLDRARDRLASLDVVGRTERLDDFAERLAAATGLALGPVRPTNVGGPAAPVSQDLVDSIREATALDRALHDWVTATIG